VPDHTTAVWQPAVTEPVERRRTILRVGPARYVPTMATMPRAPRHSPTGDAAGGTAPTSRCPSPPSDTAESPRGHPPWGLCHVWARWRRITAFRDPGTTRIGGALCRAPGGRDGSDHGVARLHAARGGRVVMARRMAQSLRPWNVVGDRTTLNG
jgi:hypothetical protein